MKKGEYYIGDPCYVFDKSWDKVLEETNMFADGEHTLLGETVFGGGTAHGDGYYFDNYGRGYGVDAGLIAIIPASLLDKDKKIDRKRMKKNCGYAHMVEMKEDFLCFLKNGVFRFGDITINTKGGR